VLGFVLAAALAFLPDARTTPGALNPAVTQANIQTTVCAHGWTATIRPPASYTNRLKRQQLAAMGLTIDPRTVEEDHRVPLEIGGNPTSPLNLWPEIWTGPQGAHAKDQLENATHRALCRGQITLDQARAVFLGDWTQAPKLPPASAPHP
jgi:hypothetical protein